MKNFIWIVPDGVRQIPYGDPLGRFKSFDKLKQDGFLELKNIYSSSPSTFMSISSFVRGIYPTKMAYAYGEFKSIGNSIITIEKEFKKKGFNIYFLTFYPNDLRDQIDNDIYHLVKNKYKLTKALYSIDTENIAIYNEYLKYFVENEKLVEPYFLFLHFNTVFYPKKDEFLAYDYNGVFEFIYGALKDKFKNANVLINSDHGFPVYDNIKNFPKINHDKILTEVSIKPVFFANFLKNEIEQNCSLVDIYPTICDLYGFKKHNFLDGISLFKLNNRHERIIRVENRFISQIDDGRQIALIKGDKKYICDVKNRQLSIYDLNDNLIKISKDDKEEWFFLKEEENFEKQRVELVTYAKEEKKDKILQVLKDRKLFILTLQNRFIDEFLNIHLTSKDKIIDISKLNRGDDLVFDTVVLFVDNIHRVYSVKDIEKIKKLNKPFYVIDRYLNIETIVKNPDEYLKEKRMVLAYMSARKKNKFNRRKEGKEW